MKILDPTVVGKCQQRQVSSFLDLKAWKHGILNPIFSPTDLQNGLIRFKCIWQTITESNHDISWEFFDCESGDIIQKRRGFCGNFSFQDVWFEFFKVVKNFVNFDLRNKVIWPLFDSEILILRFKICNCWPVRFCPWRSTGSRFLKIFLLSW